MALISTILPVDLHNNKLIRDLDLHKKGNKELIRPLDLHKKENKELIRPLDLHMKRVTTDLLSIKTVHGLEKASFPASVQ